MTTVISVENLSKIYRLGQIGTGTFTDDLKLWWAKTRGRPNPLLRIGEVDQGNRDGETLWALRDVSFTVEQGEVLGIIGRNGAGKSTLLKILSRVTAPTSGRIRVKGRIASLLEVGTGFHPELTGRENIYLNGAILGMSRMDIGRKFDEIVDFSGVEKFIDTPVKRFSSGMYVRLAFAVAAHLEPEILLVDEVLAVGDAEFQKKCLGKMGEVAKGGRTVLFVSHNMGAVRTLCGRCILVDGGRILLDDEPPVVINKHLDAPENSSGSQGQTVWRAGKTSPGGEVSLRAIRVVGSDRVPHLLYEVSNEIQVEIYYEVRESTKGLRVNLYVLTAQGEIAFVSTDHNQRDTAIAPGQYRSICIIPGHLMNIGKYLLDVHIDIPGVTRLVKSGNCVSFTLGGEGNQGSFFPERWPGVVSPMLEWRIESTSTLDVQRILLSPQGTDA